MSTTPSNFDFAHLTVPERLHLIEELWDSIEAESAEAPLTEAQRDELEFRLREAERNPGDVMTWDQVKASLDIRKDH
jgi:putative addiction module component (TIGR02574 family)